MMSSEYLNLKADTVSGAATQMVPSPGPFYIEAASVMDVMFEQLEYLVAHRSPTCPQGCAECARLAQVESCLLMPFEATRSKTSLN